MKIRKNITISDGMLERGEAIAKRRGFDDFSEMISALVREEYERRGLGSSATEMRDPPSPYKSGSVNSSPGATAACQVVAAAGAIARGDTTAPKPLTKPVKYRTARGSKKKPAS